MDSYVYTRHVMNFEISTEAPGIAVAHDACKQGMLEWARFNRDTLSSYIVSSSKQLTIIKRVRRTFMGRKIAYWVTTSIVVLMMTFSGVMYLMGPPQVVEGFAHMGYPQHLRIILGIAKLTGAIVLIVPGLRLVKEWAYVGFAFAWVLAFIGHWLAGDGISSITPLVLLGIMIVSYLTRPPSRRLALSAATV